MGELQVDGRAGEVGLDGGRLGRLTTYLDRLISAGRIPGWLAVVSRAGKVAYLGRADTGTSRTGCRSRPTRSSASTR